MIRAPSLKFIQEYFHNQHIALIGNAESMLDGHHSIDSYDKIIRLNKGYPRNHELSLGIRTDVLGLSVDLKLEEIDQEFKPEMLIWLSMPSLKKYKKFDSQDLEWQGCSPQKEHSLKVRPLMKKKNQGPKPKCRLNSFIIETAYQTGVLLWNQCKKKVGYRPSTGCLMTHFLVKNMKFKSLTLFGFDWWQTPTWYYDSGPGPHHPGAEKCYIETLQKSNNKIIIESPPVRG